MSTPGSFFPSPAGGPSVAMLPSGMETTSGFDFHQMSDLDLHKVSEDLNSCLLEDDVSRLALRLLAPWVPRGCEQAVDKHRKELEHSQNAPITMKIYPVLSLWKAKSPQCLGINIFSCLHDFAPGVALSSRIALGLDETSRRDLQYLGYNPASLSTSGMTSSPGTSGMTSSSSSVFLTPARSNFVAGTGRGLGTAAGGGGFPNAPAPLQTPGQWRNPSPGDGGSAGTLRAQLREAEATIREFRERHLQDQQTINDLRTEISRLKAELRTSRTPSHPGDRRMPVSTSDASSVGYSPLAASPLSPDSNSSSQSLGNVQSNRPAERLHAQSSIADSASPAAFQPHAAQIRTPTGYPPSDPGQGSPHFAFTNRPMPQPLPPGRNQRVMTEDGFDNLPVGMSEFQTVDATQIVAGSGFTCGLATKPPSKSVAGVMAALADTSLNPASQSHNQRHQAQIFVSDVAPSGSVQPANPDTCSAVLLHGRTVQDMAPSTSGAPSCSVSRGGPGEGSMQQCVGVRFSKLATSEIDSIAEELDRMLHEEDEIKLTVELLSGCGVTENHRVQVFNFMTEERRRTDKQRKFVCSLVGLLQFWLSQTESKYATGKTIYKALEKFSPLKAQQCSRILEYPSPNSPSTSR